jgi:hypothetical protein
MNYLKKVYRNVAKTESNDHLEAIKLVWGTKTTCLKTTVYSLGE